MTKKPTNKNKLISKLSWEGFRLNCCNKPVAFERWNLKRKERRGEKRCNSGSDLEIWQRKVDFELCKSENKREWANFKMWWNEQHWERKTETEWFIVFDLTTNPKAIPSKITHYRDKVNWFAHALGFFKEKMGWQIKCRDRERGVRRFMETMINFTL